MSENTTHLLSVKDLHTSFTTDHGEVQAVNGVSFNLDAGKVLGIVGESGSGKSVTAYSIMQILADNGRITSGEILYKGEDISRWGESKMQDFRGKCCSIIFQDPMTSLNPVFTIGSQIAEAVLLHTKSSKHEAMEKALDTLENEQERVIRRRYYEGNTLAGIATDTGTTPEWVRQMENKALRALRRPQCSRMLRPFIEEMRSGYAWIGTGWASFYHSGASSVERAAERVEELTWQYGELRAKSKNALLQ